MVEHLYLILISGAASNFPILLSGSRTLSFVTFDKKFPFYQSSVILMHFCVISRHFWVKLLKKFPFLKISKTALKF